MVTEFALPVNAASEPTYVHERANPAFPLANLLLLNFIY